MKKKLLIKFSMIIAFSFLLFFLQLHQVNANQENKKEIDITTSPEKVIFDIDNFKPGDIAIRTITITNSGSKDLNYVVSSKFKSGSTKLYNELLLKISDSKVTLFDGKLCDFTNLDAREIKTQKQEDIVMSVEFPSHLGNDFQGLKTEVEFKFYPEGTSSGIIPGDNSLPKTATNSFNLLGIGAILLIVGTILLIYQKRKKQDIKRT